MDITNDCIKNNIKRLQTAYPGMTKEFIELLTERIRVNFVNNYQLTYAVDHLLDEYTGKHLTVADVISRKPKPTEPKTVN